MPFIERWGAALVRFGTAYTGDGELGQDVAQETFLRLLQWHGRYPGREFHPGWLFTVARHTAIDLLRKTRHEPCAVLSEQGQTPQEQALTRLAVRQVLDMLSGADRECLMLFYFGEWSVREIADHLGSSPERVKMRLRRARQRFADRWEATYRG